MKAPIILAAGLGLLLVLFLATKRQQQRSPGDRLREGIEGALAEAEDRTKDLRKRAEKLRGEARQRLHDRAHELETKQRELRHRLEELGAEARRVLEGARP